MISRFRKERNPLRIIARRVVIGCSHDEWKGPTRITSITTITTIIIISEAWTHFRRSLLHSWKVYGDFYLFIYFESVILFNKCSLNYNNSSDIWANEEIQTVPHRRKHERCCLIWGITELQGCMILLATVINKQFKVLRYFRYKRELIFCKMGCKISAYQKKNDQKSDESFLSLVLAAFHGEK